MKQNCITIAMSIEQKQKVEQLYRVRMAERPGNYAGLSAMCREMLLEAVDLQLENIELEKLAPKHPGGAQ